MISLNSGFLRIGQIVRAHGVRGDVKVTPITDDPARFRSLTTAYLEMDGAYVPVDVSNVRLQPEAALLHLAGYETPEQAETCRGRYLCVDRAHAVKLPKDCYFVADLIGCEVFDTNQKRLGRITDVLQTGANDVYEIDGGRLLVPALKRVLREVDTAHKRIVFNADVLEEVACFAR